MSSVFSFFVENWGVIVSVIGALLTVASLITKLTPSPKDDEVVGKIIGFFSFLQPRDSGKVVKLPGTPVSKDVSFQSRLDNK